MSDLAHRILQATANACTCDIKATAPDLHSSTCTYRIFRETLELIENMERDSRRPNILVQKEEADTLRKRIYEAERENQELRDKLAIYEEPEYTETENEAEDPYDTLRRVAARLAPSA